MSYKAVYTCDHCGADVSQYVGEQWAAHIFTVGPNMPNLHGCSKEHLGFALAKAFGFPANLISAMGQLDEARQSHAARESEANKRIASLEASEKAVCVAAVQLEDEIQYINRRLSSLEKQLADETRKTLEKVQIELIAGRFGNALDIVDVSLTGPKKPTKPVTG
jgi:TolA-binding protein